ncbi:MAG: argininosuccinate lyase [Pseudomonadales bacterium]
MSKPKSPENKPANAPDAMWGGRFSEATDAFVERFNASVSFDQRLYAEDIQGSIAHAGMLAHCGVLSADEAKQIIEALGNIKKDIDRGKFAWSQAREDVHMNIEAELTGRIGDTGKKLHTGRSRNDQVATDIRLYLRKSIDAISTVLGRLQLGIIDLAEREASTIMPGFTHLQAAQPITFGHHLLAWNEMLERDYGRLLDCRERMNLCPLGAAALAGTTYPIDRQMTATELGFSGPTRNSLDSVSDRDFAVEFCAAAGLIMMHLSRMAEELVLWTSQQFDFIELPDRFCTGSSIMPQKKNPDVPELVRGKSGRVYGNLVALLTLMKSQPLAYNKDNQEDKEPLFDTIDTLRDCLHAFADMVPAIVARQANMRAAAMRGFTTATDLADYLVRKGTPFRDAHEIVGKAVAMCIEKDIELHELSQESLQALAPQVEADVLGVLSLEGSVAARDHVGGTAPKRVLQAASEARGRILARS